MNILVTGGAGYVGQLLVPHLANRGHKVTVVDWLLFGGWPQGANLTIQADIRDTDNFALQDEIYHSDCIVHLASIANDPSSDLDPDLTWEVNLGALSNIFNRCSDKKFVYASTSSVYGICEDAPTENHILNPLTRYSKSKAYAESFLRGYKCGTSIIVRPATLCGISPRMRFDLMVNSFVAQAVQFGKIKVWGPTQYRANLHVLDMIDVYTLLVEDEDLSNSTFNVVAENMQVGDIAKLVAEHTGAQIEYLEDNKDLRSYRIDGSLAEVYFGWKPKRTVERAIMEVIAAIQDGTVDPTDFRNYNCQWMRLQGYGSAS